MGSVGWAKNVGWPQSSEVSASPDAWFPGRLQERTLRTIAAEFVATAAPSVLMLNGEVLA